MADAVLGQPRRQGDEDLAGGARRGLRRRTIASGAAAAVVFLEAEAAELLGDALDGGLRDGGGVAPGGGGESREEAGGGSRVVSEERSGRERRVGRSEGLWRERRWRGVEVEVALGNQHCFHGEGGSVTRSEADNAVFASEIGRAHV